MHRFETLSEELACETVRHRSNLEQSSSSFEKIINLTTSRNDSLNAGLKKQVQVRDKLDCDIRACVAHTSTKASVRGKQPGKKNRE